MGGRLRLPRVLSRAPSELSPSRAPRRRQRRVRCGTWDAGRVPCSSARIAHWPLFSAVASHSARLCGSHVVKCGARFAREVRTWDRARRRGRAQRLSFVDWPWREGEPPIDPLQVTERVVTPPDLSQASSTGWLQASVQSSAQGEGGIDTSLKSASARGVGPRFVCTRPQPWSAQHWRADEANDIRRCLWFTPKLARPTPRVPGPSRTRRVGAPPLASSPHS